MSSDRKPRRVVIGRRVFIEGSDEHKRFLQKSGANEKSEVKSVEPEKTNRSGSGEKSGKSE